LLRRNIRGEFITEAELLGKLREQGVEYLSKLKLVNIESDEQISVIQYEEKPHKPPERRGK
jgi:uncharacterized membrane protein YcaP (DUF421 family)